MIAVDTNVLVRLVTQDDAAQARRAAEVLRRQPVYVAKTVLLEMEWVLRHAYGLQRTAILKAFEGILGLPNVESEDSMSVYRAIHWYEHGLDFADALHLASSHRARQFFTFDTKLARKAAKIGDLSIVSR